MNNYRHKFSYGRFSVLNDTNVVTSTAVGNYIADLKSVEGFVSAGRKKSLELRDSYSDYSGVNKKYVNEDGVYEPALALAEFGRATTERRLVKEDTLSLLKMQTSSDSHELFLYNMLLSWLRAELYAGQGERDGILRVKTDCYSDSHVEVFLDQPAQDHTYEVILEAPCPVETVLSDDWNYRNSGNYWQFPMVVRYSATNKHQEYFYLAHLRGRVNRSALNGEFNFASIAVHRLALEPVGGQMTVFDEEPDIDWGEPKLMWQWIVDYVTLNRLEQQFAAAFETVVSVTFQPTYHTMEATAWYNVTSEVILPEFIPTRAKISLALEGEPFIPFSAAYEFVVTDAKTPGQCILSAAMANYYMYVGLYAILADAGRSVENWHYAALCTDEDLYVLKTPYARAAAISAATGKEFTTLMSEACSYRPRIEDLSRVTHVTVAKSLDGTVQGEIAITQVPSFVSGALVYGTVVDHYDHLAHLAPAQVIKPRDIYDLDTSFRTTLQLSNLYRVYGHDVTWENRNRVGDILPYGAAKTCMIDPYSLGEVAEEPFAVRQGTSSRREGRAVSLPNLANLFDEDRVVVRPSKPVLTLCEWGRRDKPLPPTRFVKKTRVVNEFKIRAGATSSRALLRALPRKPAPSGFQVADTTIAPMIPVAADNERIIVPDTAATSNDA
jgi:hypothetical protein